MKYVVMSFLALVSVLSILDARENPFVPVNAKDNMGKATQIKDTRKDFNSITAKLPSSARILKKLELHYQNLDGSIKSVVVPVDEKIDWHDTLVLQKLNMQKPQETMSPKKMATAPLPAPKMKPMVKKDFKNILDFTVQGDSIHISTKDRKIRDFLITDPYKIVIDFKRELNFYTKTYKLMGQKVSSVTFGKHAGYYRMVIELDGQYRYKLQKTGEGYSIKLY